MRTKLSLQLTALLLSGTASIAVAGPGLEDYALRTRIANAQRTPVPAVNAGPARYVATPTGKGGTVAAVRDDTTTNIAVFKSAKKDACCPSKR